ncbi:MAG: extracellular solute-binding protein [bacterium]|nr:extracellular solute-binding protein [bacterium]
MGKLQIGIIIVIIIIVLFAILIFSGVLPGIRPFGTQKSSSVLAWGTLPEEALNQSLSDFNRDFRNIAFSYVEKAADTFESELVNALASGQGPDLVIFPSEFILEHRDKFSLITPELLSERAFRDTFADGTELLILKSGTLGLPLVIDPLVLYFNRDLFQNEGLALPPKTWDEFLASSGRLTKIDPAGNIIQSGSALGLESNVDHFKEILSLLILETGNPIVERETLRVALEDNSSETLRPAENALRFFTEFSNPQKSSYAWSRAQGSSFEAFAQSRLAMYFGFGSEFEKIRASNPHLNFDLAPVPQIPRARLNLTYGRIISAGISRQARDPLSAWQVMQFLVSRTRLREISQNLLLAPARRDLLAEKNQNPILETLFREAIKSRFWLEADAVKTTEIFSNMVKSVYSGRKEPIDAVRDAKLQLETLYPKP